MKSLIAVFAMLVLSGGFFDAPWAGPDGTAPAGDKAVEAPKNTHATVTLIVAGMMKSKSGAT